MARATFIDAIRLARLLRRGAEEATADFSPAYRLLMTLTESGAGQLI